MAMLEIRQIVKRFGTVTVIDGISLQVEHGDFFTLLGPSGCGKTTLLRLIAGFEKPDAGEILLDGENLSNVPPERRPMHTVFQSYALFPHLTVARNVAFPLEMARVPRDEIRWRVGLALDDVQLGEFAQRWPHELSGGQRQRVAIARALVDRPRLLLLDEPLGALDAKLRAQMKLELISLQKDIGITFIYVTHDQGEALALSHCIALMNKGHLEQVGKPETIYRRPASRFVADFIGQCNLLDAVVTGIDDAGMSVAVLGVGACRTQHVAGVVEGQKGVLAVRPESVELTVSPKAGMPELTGFRGCVRESLYEGDVTFYAVVLNSGVVMRAMLPNTDPARLHALDAGTNVTLAWHADASHFLSS